MSVVDYLIVIGIISVIVGLFFGGWWKMLSFSVIASLFINDFVRSFIESYCCTDGDFVMGLGVFPFVSNWANFVFWAIVAFGIMFWLHRRKLKTSPR